MNRRDRRRAAALNRGRRTGYLHRIMAGGLDQIVGRPGVHLATIEHDGACTIYQGGPCCCVPDISINVDGTVRTIDERGQIASKARVS
jgi:hypothetical protein